MLKPIILAGGTGSRLWPVSRQLNPKQFLSLCSDETMLQTTILRLKDLPTSGPVVICNEDHRFLVAEQLRQLNITEATILLEPVGRNTAPAIALAALQAVAKGEDPLLLVLAADHFIKDESAFCDSVNAALPLADEGFLVTFGVVPTQPETGYGYVKRGEEIPAKGGYKVLQFVEKPDAMTAQSYFDAGDYYWNSGMFLFKASRYLDELKVFRPDIFDACDRALAGATVDADFNRVDVDVFASCPADSIDYAVMEKTSHAVVVPLDAGWSDIGSWSALWEVSQKDEQQNVIRGDVLAQNTTGSLIKAEHRLVATLGIDDLIIVETKDAVLVAAKNCAQDVKNIVEKISNNGRHEHLNHREVYRPWGMFDQVDAGPRYQVKRITVKPGAKLSVQMHHHRAEHWVVVSGTAKVTNGESSFLVTENESTFIPIGQVHSLENPGKIPLELIEVQSGSYLGEDDIVRFEDNYGRS